MLMEAATPFPGFLEAGPGFARPFEMLMACHARTRRSLVLLERLQARISERGHDEQTRGAASDVLRYFGKAAPLHHEDEDRFVYPVLEGAQDPDLSAAVGVLHGDHEKLERLWGDIEPDLRRWAGEDPGPCIDAHVRERIALFTQIYVAHMYVEEAAIFPSALAHMDEQALSEMSADMERRRTAANDSTLGPQASGAPDAQIAVPAPARTVRRGYLRRRRAL